MPRENAAGWEKNGRRRFDALIATALKKDGTPDTTRRIDLTAQKCAAEDSQPASRIVDHMDRGAVERYLRNSGARFAAALGGDHGQTVDSFFGDGGL